MWSSLFYSVPREEGKRRGRGGNEGTGEGWEGEGKEEKVGWCRRCCWRSRRSWWRTRSFACFSPAVETPSAARPLAAARVAACTGNPWSLSISAGACRSISESLRLKRGRPGCPLETPCGGSPRFRPLQPPRTSRTRSPRWQSLARCPSPRTLVRWLWVLDRSQNSGRTQMAVPLWDE